MITIERLGLVADGMDRTLATVNGEVHAFDYSCELLTRDGGAARWREGVRWWLRHLGALPSEIDAVML